MRKNPFEQRQQLADGWMSFCHVKNTLKAWESLFSPERLAVEKNPIGGLATFLQPFVYLKERGTTESFGEEIETIRQATKIVRERGIPGKDEETLNRLDAITGGLRLRYQAAEKAEKLLKKYVWKFDPKTGKVCAVQKRKGAELLTRIIQSLGTVYGTNAEGRRKIQEELSPFELDAGPRGNIARALENIQRMTKPSNQ